MGVFHNNASTAHSECPHCASDTCSLPLCGESACRSRSPKPSLRCAGSARILSFYLTAVCTHTSVQPPFCSHQISLLLDASGELSCRTAVPCIPHTRHVLAFLMRTAHFHSLCGVCKSAKKSQHIWSPTRVKCKAYWQHCSRIALLLGCV